MSAGHNQWRANMPAPTTSAPRRPPTPRRRRCDPPADRDEVSAGNAGFEQADRIDPATAAERAEYVFGWRSGVLTGLIGGGLLGALAALSAVWLGVRAGLSVL